IRASITAAVHGDFRNNKPNDDDGKRDHEDHRQDHLEKQPGKFRNLRCGIAHGLSGGKRSRHGTQAQDPKRPLQQALDKAKHDGDQVHSKILMMRTPSFPSISTNSPLAMSLPLATRSMASFGKRLSSMTWPFFNESISLMVMVFLPMTATKCTGTSAVSPTARRSVLAPGAGAAPAGVGGGPPKGGGGPPGAGAGPGAFAGLKAGGLGLKSKGS